MAAPGRAATAARRRCRCRWLPLAVALVGLLGTRCTAARPSKINGEEHIERETVVDGVNTAVLRGHVQAMVAGFAEARKEGAPIAPPPRTKAPKDRGGIFCYALTRTPAEETVPLLAKQMKAACDAHVFFGHTANQSLGVLAAYTEEEEKHGWQHQQEDMTLKGAWKSLAARGDLWKYAWLVKFDTDSFVRPSTFRKHLQRYNHTADNIISCGGRGGTLIEGWFVATSAKLVDDVYRVNWSEQPCDPSVVYEMVSGHNEDNEENRPSKDTDCSQQMSLVSTMTHEGFKDEQGHLLTAQPEDPTKGQGRPPRCQKMPTMVLEHFRRGAGSHGKATELCGCKPGGAFDEACVSEDVAIVHPVKAKALYEELAGTLH